MPSVATLISRAAARYFGVGPQTVARGLAGAAARNLRAGGRDGARPLPPLPLPAPTRLGRSMYATWLAGLVLFALVVVNVDLFLPHRASAFFRIVVGAVLLIEGASLLVRRSTFRAAIAARLTATLGQHRSRLRRTAWKHAIGAGLTLLGLAWIAAGMLDLLRGAIAVL